MKRANVGSFVNSALVLWSWWLLASLLSYSFKQLYHTNLTIHYYNISIYWLHSFIVTDDTCQTSSTMPHVLMHLPIPSLHRCGQHFLSLLSSNSVSTRTTGGFRLETLHWDSMLTLKLISLNASAAHLPVFVVVVRFLVCVSWPFCSLGVWSFTLYMN